MSDQCPILNAARAVAVYGASGHTGGFVVRELMRRNFAVIAIGRDRAKLEAAGLPAGVSLQTAGLDDPQALALTLEGASFLVNCAGPFLDTADLLIQAALAAGIHYIDVTPEQESARVTFERYSEVAERAGVMVIPAMGFYGGLGDLLVTAAFGDWTGADEVRIGLALDSWKPTEGTRLTGQRNTYPRVTINDGKLVPLALPAPNTTWPFADPFGLQEMVEMPFTEAVLIQSHLQVRRFHNYLNLLPLLDLRDPSTPGPTASDALGRSAQKFLIEVEVRQGDKIRAASATGRDIYAITAPLVSEAVARILNAATTRGGVFAPGALFDAAEFLAELSPELATSRTSTTRS